MTALACRSNLPAAVSVVLVATALAGPAARAQKPERQAEVRIPGLDVSVKAGWQIFFHQGCRFAVPGPWRADADGGQATAPDGSSISVRMFRITSWSAHKAQIKAAFGRVNVMHEDSERRLWFEIGDKPRVQHYVDVANGPGLCSALLEIRSAASPETEDLTKRIVDSVGPAPDRWPTDTK